MVGVPDPEWGQRVVAFVVLRAGRASTSTRRATGSRRAPPRLGAARGLHRLDALPLLANGKVDRLRLRGGPDDGRTRAPVVWSVPMTTRFRGITVREGVLLRGDAGWGEFSPFLEYDDAVAAPWLAGGARGRRPGLAGPAAGPGPGQRHRPGGRARSGPRRSSGPRAGCTPPR